MSPNPADAPAVSFVVLSADAHADFRRCAQALGARAFGVPREILVLREAGGAPIPPMEDLRELPLPWSGGFADAFNRAAREARGDVLVFVDLDVELPHTWVSDLLRPLARPAVGAALPAPGSPLDGLLFAVRRADFLAAGGLHPGRDDALELLVSALVARGLGAHRWQPDPSPGRAPAAAAPRPGPPRAAQLSRPPITVVLPVRDAARTLRECLVGVARNLRGGDEVVIADAASGDDTLREAYLFAADHPRATRVLPGAGPTLPDALRAGVFAAVGELVVVLPATVQPPDGFFDFALRLLAERRDVQVLAAEVPRRMSGLVGPAPALRAAAGADAAALASAELPVVNDALRRAGVSMGLVAWGEGRP